MNSSNQKLYSGSTTRRPCEPYELHPLSNQHPSAAIPPGMSTERLLSSDGEVVARLGPASNDAETHVVLRQRGKGVSPSFMKRNSPLFQGQTQPYRAHPRQLGRISAWLPPCQDRGGKG